MSKKFSIENIRGYNSEPIKDNDNSERDIINLVDGLISPVSRSMGKKMDIKHIPRQQIEKNPNNGYSIGDIEELKWMIQTSGLKQPLEVMRIEDGKYMLLGGERRLTAIDMLIADPEIESWSEYSEIPCVVSNPDDIKLPLKAESKEMFAILGTNKTSRNYTDSDAQFEISQWKKIISELREKGIEKLPFEDSEIQIAGRRNSEIIADLTGKSERQVKRHSAIEDKGSESILLAIKDNVISVTLAEEAVRELTHQQQDELVKMAVCRGSKITREDIQTMKRGNQDASLVELSAARIKRDFSKAKKAASENPFLTEEGLFEYEQLMERIIKLFTL